jgi:glucose/arabinose dehydrogenase
MRARNGGLVLGMLTAMASWPTEAPAQDQPAQDQEVIGHSVRPERVDATEERRQGLELPEGFALEVFAKGLENPRMMAIQEDGTLYVSQPEPDNVVRLRDTDGDGKADEDEVVASGLGQQLHGLAIHDGRLYIATIHKVYAADIGENGSLGEPQELIGNLPDGGQHPKRTIGFDSEGRLYVSVGSTCNACEEPDPEHATILRAEPDGSSRTVFAKGLRNTIGFAWHPQTGELWGSDHGSDWRGDNDPPDELNRIEEGRDYGWPYCFGDREADPHTEAPKGYETSKDYCRQKTQGMVLGYTAHSAPIDFLFYDGAMFPEAYGNDAFVAMRGSWNRKPPTGYKVVRVDFEKGEPKAVEDFLTGFLIDGESDEPRHFGRLAGLAIMPDGALLVSDDTNGMIYRVSYASEGTQASK